MADNFQFRDANSVTQTLVTTDLGSDQHVPHHFRRYLERPDVTGSLTVNGSQVALNVGSFPAIVLQVVSAAANGFAAFFEASLDSTNGSDGTWFQVMGQRTQDGSAAENQFSGISSTPTYAWLIGTAGYSWFRIRCTGATSGTLNVRISPCDDLVLLSRPANTQAVAGNVAHDSPVSGSPVRTATKAVATMPAAVSAANDVADTLATMQGVPLVTLDAVPAQRLRASVWLTTTSDVVLFAAQAAGLRSHLTDMQVINTGTTVELIIKDGTTEIWRIPLPQNVPVALNGIRSALMSTAATALNATLSAAGTVRVNAQGYVAV